MLKTKYTSEYFFEKLEELRRIVSISKNYKTVKELMSVKDNTIDIKQLNTNQGLEK